MGLTKKLLVRFGAVMAVLLVMGIVLVVFLTYHGRALENVLRENYDSVIFCERMESSINRLQAIAQTQLLAGEPADVAAAGEARETFEQMVRKQIDNCYLEGERGKSEAILAAWRKFLQSYSTMAAAPNEDREKIYQTRLLPEFNACKAGLEDVSQMNLTNLAEVNTRIRGAVLEIRTVVIVLVVIGLGLATVLVVLTIRDLTRPLAQLTESVHQVERGDLDAVVHTSQHDEIGKLAEAFNAMAAKLREFRRMDHERLLRTQQTTQAAIDSLPDAVAVLDAAGNIEIANKTAQVHFSLAPGGNLRAVRPDWAQAFLDDVIATGRPHATDGYRSSIQIFDASGERFLLPRAVPILDDAGKAIGVTLVLVEVTHLRRADEFKSGLLSTASHELKTPLTSIRMAMRMMLDKRIGDLTPKQETLLLAARADSERLVRILEDILTIGRVEAGPGRLNMAAVDIREIISRALAPVQPPLAEKHISVETRFAGEGLIVRGDAALLACALTNLLSNAVKYGPADSTITLTVSGDEASNEVAVAVKDRGPGIPEEFRARIFEKFFRIPSASGPSGAGLGLAIAREIAILHGGGLDLTNDPGAGCTFVLHLPRAG